MDSADLTTIGALVAAVVALAEVIKLLVARLLRKNNHDSSKKLTDQIVEWQHKQELRQVSLDNKLEKIEKALDKVCAAQHKAVALVESQDRLIARVNALIDTMRRP